MSNESQTTTEISKQEVRGVFDGFIEMSEQIDTLETKRRELIESRRDNVRELTKKLDTTSLPEDAKIFAAALMVNYLLNEPSADRLVHDFQFLTSIEANIKEARGQNVIWFSSESRTTIIRDFGGPNETERVHFLHLGTLTEDASLILDPRSSYDLTIPVVGHKLSRVEFSIFDRAKPLKGAMLRGNFEDGLSQRIDISEGGALVTTDFIIGDEAIKLAMVDTSVNSIAKLKAQFPTSKLK